MSVKLHLSCTVAVTAFSDIRSLISALSSIAMRGVTASIWNYWKHSRNPSAFMASLGKTAFNTPSSLDSNPGHNQVHLSFWLVFCNPHWSLYPKRLRPQKSSFVSVSWISPPSPSFIIGLVLWVPHFFSWGLNCHHFLLKRCHLLCHVLVNITFAWCLTSHF